MARNAVAGRVPVRFDVDRRGRLQRPACDVYAGGNVVKPFWSLACGDLAWPVAAPRAVLAATYLHLVVGVRFGGAATLHGQYLSSSHVSLFVFAFVLKTVSHVIITVIIFIIFNFI